MSIKLNFFNFFMARSISFATWYHQSAGWWSTTRPLARLAVKTLATISTGQLTDMNKSQRLKAVKEGVSSLNASTALTINSSTRACYRSELKNSAHCGVAMLSRSIAGDIRRLYLLRTARQRKQLRVKWTAKFSKAQSVQNLLQDGKEFGSGNGRMLISE